MKRIPIFLFCLFTALSASAQLSLDDCRRMAREHYPQIRQYELIRLTTEYTLSNARRAYLPQLSLSGQATWQTAVTDFPDLLKDMLSSQGVAVPGLNKDQYKVAVELNQTIWDGGKTSADKRIAEAGSAEQQRATDVDMYALEGRVDEIFFGILLLEERMEQTRLTMTLLEDNLAKMRAYLRSGAAMQSDVDAVEAELLTVNQQLTQIETSCDSYRRMLGIFIGQPYDGRKLSRPDMVEVSADTPARPEQALFDARIDKLSAQESLVKSSTRPRFGLFAQGYYGYPGLNFMQDMLTDSWSWNAIVGVQMSWNFGAYYTKGNSLKQLRTAQRQVEVQRDIFLFNNRLQTTQESGEITRLRRSLSDDDRIVALRRSVREAAEAKLRNGVIDTSDLLRKITDEATAVTARSAREIELLKTIYELKHTINR